MGDGKDVKALAAAGRRARGEEDKGSGRPFRNESLKEMAFPHPQSRKDKYRKEDKPNSRGVVWNVFKRAINITEYRNTKDDVNPAKNRTFDALVHDLVSYDC